MTSHSPLDAGFRGVLFLCRVKKSKTFVIAGGTLRPLIATTHAIRQPVWLKID
jgi:hypothetical protein